MSEDGYLSGWKFVFCTFQVMDPSGRFLRAFGSQGTADGKFNYPWGVTTDALGFIYVCDKENHRVQVEYYYIFVNWLYFYTESIAFFFIIFLYFSLGFPIWRNICWKIRLSWFKDRSTWSSTLYCCIEYKSCDCLWFK